MFERRPAIPVRLTLPRVGHEPREAPNVRSHVQRFIGAYAALILVGTVLLSLPWATRDGSATAPVDALFTATSAAAVTGLATVETRDHWNGFGQAVILALIQAGGLGFMVGASIVFQMMRRGASLRDALLLRDGEPALTLGQITTLSRRILAFTLVSEATGAVVLTLGFWLGEGDPLPRALWQGVFFAVSSFCNAGFDLTGGFLSVIPYRTDAWLLLTLAALVQLGALSYLVVHEVVTRRRWRRFSLDTRLVLIANAIALASGTVAYLSLEWTRSLGDRPGWAKPIGAFFQSAQSRTGGITSANLAEATGATLLIMVALMLVGGASGSTAGGVRLTTVAVVVVAVVATLRGDEEARVFGRRLPTPLIFRALAVIALFILTHFLATLLLATTEDAIAGKGFGFVAIFFETMSALATVGFSTGITPELSVPGKLILVATMFLGRIGPISAAVALQRRQSPARYRFPEATVRIG